MSSPDKSSTEHVSAPDDIFSSHATKFQLPSYIKNMFLACGYDTLEVIADMDVCPATNPNDIGVIPCQINKEFRVTSRILTKLGTFVVPVVLITHANF